MKHCLELLKGVVPLVGDLTRHTTLGLLTNATSLIKVLRETEQMQKNAKEQLIREQQYLRWQHEQLARASEQHGGQFRGVAGLYRVRPSVSESSSASNESSSSLSSELDDVDVIGSGLSDTDDRSSDVSANDICGIASETLSINLL
jgi:hypothetical protein